MNIDFIQPVQPLGTEIAGGARASGNAAFSDLLHAAYRHAETSGSEASRMVEAFLSGERQDLHSVALTAQKASLEFEMLLQVRNKIVQAYQEVMRMQL